MWLFVVQVLSGIVWSAYELAFFLMFLDYIPQRRRADMLTIYNFAQAVAWCSGALLADGGSLRMEPMPPHIMASSSSRLWTPGMSRIALSDVAKPGTLADPVVPCHQQRSRIKFECGGDQRDPRRRHRFRSRRQPHARRRLGGR